MMARALACPGAAGTGFRSPELYDDGQLMAGCRYTLMFPDGRSEAGVTDEHGVTGWHYAESAINITLNILMD